jgi:hypothetical protein
LIDVDEIDDELWCVDGTNVRPARRAAGKKIKGLKNPLLAIKRSAVLVAVLA